jgi:hypothetical protein
LILNFFVGAVREPPLQIGHCRARFETVPYGENEVKMKNKIIIIAILALALLGCAKEKSVHGGITKKGLIKEVVAEAKKNLEAVEIAKLGTEVKKSRSAYFDGLETAALDEFSAHFKELYTATPENLEKVNAYLDGLKMYEKKYEKDKAGNPTGRVLVLRVTDREAIALFNVLVDFIAFMEKAKKNGNNFEFK